jgi:hypothetical protein
VYGYLLVQEQLEEWVHREYGITTATHEESSREYFAGSKESTEPGWEAEFQQHLHERVFSAALRIIYVKTRLSGGRARAVRLKIQGQVDTGLCFELANNTSAVWLALPTLPHADQAGVLKKMLGTTEEPQWYPLNSN